MRTDRCAGDERVRPIDQGNVDSAERSARAALRPPNPPPTMTTFGSPLTFPPRRASR
jgi:hypothetical protein